MAQHNTDYGLVYDDEGKICVTKRTDIIPFSGVTSYAVETGTTNYWNNDITDYAYNIVSGDVTFENTVYNGRPALKCVVTGTDPEIRFAFKHSAGNINPGDTYTASIGVAALSSEITGLRFSAAYVVFTTLSFSGFSAIDHNWGKAGNRIYATYTRPMDEVATSFYACVFFKEAGTFYLYDYQLEKKPFASSFVIGSRPAGRLVVDVEDLGFNPGTDDWVVSYRKYPIATRNDTLTSYNLCSIGYLAGLGYYFNWGKDVSNNFRIYVKYNDGTYILVLSPTFNPDDYFRHWHSEVALRHGNVVQYWVDGVLQCQATLTKSLPNYNYNDVGLTLGGTQGFAPHNSLITNITYGKYTDQWTPEYIQRISAMTSTFYVPTKRVIV